MKGITGAVCRSLSTAVCSVDSAMHSKQSLTLTLDENFFFPSLESAVKTLWQIHVAAGLNSFNAK